VLRKYLQMTPKPDGMRSISTSGPVGLGFAIAILFIFLAGIHPTRWLLVSTAALGVATTLILRHARRG
jgi:hypothetical protein